MLAYHNDPHLKDLFVKVLSWHRDQDRVVQGAYWEDADDEAECKVNGISFISDGRGCAVGCSIESLGRILKRTRLNHQDHGLYEELIGVPRVLARLEDSIFEGLPIEQAPEWPIQFAEAIQPGADLSLIWPRFAMWLLGDAEYGVIRFAKTDQQRKAIRDVIDAYGRLIEGSAPTVEEWRSYKAAAAAASYAAASYAAASYAAAAYAAAAYAADAADAAASYAASYDAADAAASYDAAAYAAAAADDAAAYAAAAADDAAASYAAAKSKMRITQADYLLKLLKECAA